MRDRYPQLRWHMLATVLGVGFVCIFLRLSWVQVARADFWKELAKIASTEVEFMEARRGQILDRRGNVLARTDIHTSIGVAYPHEWIRSEHVSDVAALIGLSERTIRQRLAGRTTHTVIIEDAPLDASTRLKLSSMPNMSVDSKSRRVRPHGRTARQLLGNVTHAGEGSSGLERVFEETLSGQPGERLLRQDAFERLRSRAILIAPVDGSDVVTTLDLRVQLILERELEAARISAGAHAAQGIVLEVNTGEVLALAQAPFVAPAPNGDKDVDRWRVMAATDQFEPGSVFKLFTLATLLSESVVDTSTMFDGTGRPGDYRVTHTFGNGRKIRDVHPVGKVSIRQAFVTSSNIVFAKAVEERLKTSEFHDAIRKFGFIERPGTGFRSEAHGLLRDRDQWTSYMMQSLAMGQAISVTLLQLASGTAAVLGDGQLRTPIFAREIVSPDGTSQVLEAVVRRRNVVSPRVTAKLRAVARGVVHEDYGTAKSARVDGLSIAGKTSTAQLSTAEGYIDNLYTPIFVGAVPAEDPRLVVIIVLHGAPGERTYGGNTAAPCFASVIREIAARTPWLEGAFEVAEAGAALTIPAPALLGRTVEEVLRLSESSSWHVDVSSLPSGARAVGQMPAAGTPMPPGARLQMAWAEARR